MTTETNNDLVVIEQKGEIVWETPRGEIAVTGDHLRQLFKCPQASDFEVYAFTQICKAHKLNPFLGEAYLVKFRDSPAQLIVGKDVFNQRAEANPQFDGIEAGLIVTDKDNNIIEREGTFKLDTENIQGAWAIIHRKDMRVPFKHTVSYGEYKQNRPSATHPWNRMPGTMIVKVVVSQALRLMFPHDMAGLYDQSERQDNDVIEIMAEAVEMGSDEADADPAPLPPPSIDIDRIIMDLETAEELSREDRCPMHGLVYGKENLHTIFEEDDTMSECKLEEGVQFLAAKFQAVMQHHFPDDWKKKLADAVTEDDGVWKQAVTIHDKAVLSLDLARTEVTPPTPVENYPDDIENE